MDYVMLLGRLLFVLFFLDSGIGNLRRHGSVAERLAAPSMPAPIRRFPGFFNLASAALLLAGSVMVALGIWADLGALFLAAFLVPVTLTSHPYWRVADPAQRRQQWKSFLRNVTFFGACLFLFGFFAGYGPRTALTLSGPLFDLR